MVHDIFVNLLDVEAVLIEYVQRAEIFLIDLLSHLPFLLLLDVRCLSTELYHKTPVDKVILLNSLHTHRLYSPPRHIVSNLVLKFSPVFRTD